VPLDLDPTSVGDLEPPPLRRPGPPRTWRERLDDLADATGTTPVRILVGAVAAVVALAVGLWMTRPPAAPVEASLPFASTTVPSDLPTSTSSTAEVPAVLVVHVAGAVVAPGVHELEPGARVVDAIAAAGGLLPAADGARLNLAAPVADGERVYVPVVGEEPPPVVRASGASSASGASGAAGESEGPVDLNTADEAALDGLPGIGPSTAAAIIEHRTKIGRFGSVDELLDVRGIGEAKLEQLRPLVTV
jgi:competence protein ComEA